MKCPSMKCLSMKCPIYEMSFYEMSQHLFYTVYTFFNKKTLKIEFCQTFSTKLQLKSIEILQYDLFTRMNDKVVRKYGFIIIYQSDESSINH